MLGCVAVISAPAGLGPIIGAIDIGPGDRFFENSAAGLYDQWPVGMGFDYCYGFMRRSEHPADYDGRSRLWRFRHIWWCRTDAEPGSDRTDGTALSAVQLDCALFAARAALITGRNHHSTGIGIISEQSTGYPGYDSAIGVENATARGLADVPMGFTARLPGRPSEFPRSPYDVNPICLLSLAQYRPPIPLPIFGRPSPSSIRRLVDPMKADRTRCCSRVRRDANTPPLRHLPDGAPDPTANRHPK